MTLSALLGAALLPIIVFLIGAFLMQWLTGHHKVVRRMKDRLPDRRDRKPLNQRLLGYDRAAVQRHWGALDDPDLLRSERNVLLLDLLFPLLYGAAFVVSLWLAWKWLDRPLRFDFVRLLVPVAICVLADWTENSLQLKQLGLFEQSQALEDVPIRIASAATQIKLLAFAGCWILVLVLLAH